MNFSDKYVEVITQADIEAAAERKSELERAMAANAWAYKNTPRVVYDWNGNGNAMVYSGKERIL
jgi:hypothetical protein